MVLSMKKTFTLALCVSTFAASEVAQTSALRPRRNLAGIHHTIKYAPHVVEQPKSAPEEEKIEDKETLDSHDSFELNENDSADINLKDSEELVIDGTKGLDVDMDAIDLKSGEELETDLELKDGVVDVEVEDDEDYTQDLDFEDNEDVDEIIEVPEGAKSIHLRMHKGDVDLEIIKSATIRSKEGEQKASTEAKEEVQTASTENKEETMTASTEAKEESVSHAAETKNWFWENSSKPAFVGGIIGAAVGMVGVAGVAIARGRKRGSAESTLSSDVIADAEAAAEANEAESESDSDSDEDVEAGVTAVTEDTVEKKKKTNVVEGSV